MKPWLLEVNASPSISVSGDVDRKVKILLLNDSLDIMGWDTHKYPPEEMRQEHAALERARRSPRTASPRCVSPDFSSANPEGNDYKRVKLKVNSRWRRRSPRIPKSTMPPPRRWSSMGRGGGSPNATHAPEQSDGIPVLACNEPAWVSEREGGYERIYPFSKKTKLASQIIDPLGYRSNAVDSPFVSQQFDQLVVSEIRARSKRLYESQRSSRKTTNGSSRKHKNTKSSSSGGGGVGGRFVKGWRPVSHGGHTCDEQQAYS
mmetsp:Transcript_3426/g.6709  ORF Transcript_3426/g.6709 Transcript_3426/m.6709 type:complete len:261 (-) Transcript_3426:911-1693(-)